MLYCLVGTLIVIMVIVFVARTYGTVILMGLVELLVVVASIYLTLSSYNWWGDTKMFTEDFAIYKLEKLPVSDCNIDSFILFGEEVSATAYLNVSFWSEDAAVSLSVRKENIRAYVTDGEPYIEVTAPKLSKWYYYFIAVAPEKTVDLYLTESDYVEYQQMLLGLE